MATNQQQLARFKRVIVQNKFSVNTQSIKEIKQDSELIEKELLEIQNKDQNLQHQIDNQRQRLLKGISTNIHQLTNHHFQTLKFNSKKHFMKNNVVFTNSEKSNNTRIFSNEKQFKSQNKWIDKVKQLQKIIHLLKHNQILYKQEISALNTQINYLNAFNKNKSVINIKNYTKQFENVQQKSHRDQKDQINILKNKDKLEIQTITFQIKQQFQKQKKQLKLRLQNMQNQIKQKQILIKQKHNQLKNNNLQIQTKIYQKIQMEKDNNHQHQIKTLNQIITIKDRENIKQKEINKQLIQQYDKQKFNSQRKDLEINNLLKFVQNNNSQIKILSENLKKCQLKHYNQKLQLIRKFETEQKKQSQKITTLNSQIDKLKKQIESYESHLRVKEQNYIVTKDKQINQLLTINIELQKSISKLKEQNNQLRLHQKKIIKIQKQFEQTQKQYQNDIKNLTQQINKIQNDFYLAKEQFHKNTDLRIINNKISSKMFQQTVQPYKSQIDNKKKYQQIKLENQKITLENLSLKFDKQNIIKQINQMQRTIASLKKQLSQKQSQIVFNRSKCQENKQLLKENTKLEKSIKNMQEQNNQLKLDLKNVKELEKRLNMAETFINQIQQQQAKQIKLKLIEAQQYIQFQELQIQKLKQIINKKSICKTEVIQQQKNNQVTLYQQTNQNNFQIQFNNIQSIQQINNQKMNIKSQNKQPQIYLQTQKDYDNSIQVSCEFSQLKALQYELMMVKKQMKTLYIKSTQDKELKLNYQQVEKQIKQLKHQNLKLVHEIQQFKAFENQNTRLMNQLKLLKSQLNGQSNRLNFQEKKIRIQQQKLRQSQKQIKNLIKEKQSEYQIVIIQKQNKIQTLINQIQLHKQQNLRLRQIQNSLRQQKQLTISSYPIYQLSDNTTHSILKNNYQEQITKLKNNIQKISQSQNDYQILKEKLLQAQNYIINLQLQIKNFKAHQYKVNSIYKEESNQIKTKVNKNINLLNKQQNKQLLINRQGCIQKQNLTYLNKQVKNQSLQFKIFQLSTLNQKYIRINNSLEAKLQQSQNQRQYLYNQYSKIQLQLQKLDTTSKQILYSQNLQSLDVNLVKNRIKMIQDTIYYCINNIKQYYQSINKQIKSQMEDLKKIVSIIQISKNQQQINYNSILISKIKIDMCKLKSQYNNFRQNICEAIRTTFNQIKQCGKEIHLKVLQVIQTNQNKLKQKIFNFQQKQIQIINSKFLSNQQKMKLLEIQKNNFQSEYKSIQSIMLQMKKQAQQTKKNFLLASQESKQWKKQSQILKFKLLEYENQCKKLIKKQNELNQHIKQLEKLNKNILFSGNMVQCSNKESLQERSLVFNNQNTNQAKYLRSKLLQAENYIFHLQNQNEYLLSQNNKLNSQKQKITQQNNQIGFKIIEISENLNIIHQQNNKQKIQLNINSFQNQFYKQEEKQYKKIQMQNQEKKYIQRIQQLQKQKQQAQIKKQLLENQIGDLIVSYNLLNDQFNKFKVILNGKDMKCKSLQIKNSQLQSTILNLRGNFNSSQLLLQKNTNNKIETKQFLQTSFSQSIKVDNYDDDNYKNQNSNNFEKSQNFSLKQKSMSQLQKEKDKLCRQKQQQLSKNRSLRQQINAIYKQLQQYKYKCLEYQKNNEKENIEQQKKYLNQTLQMRAKINIILQLIQKKYKQNLNEQIKELKQFLLSCLEKIQYLQSNASLIQQDLKHILQTYKYIFKENQLFKNPNKNKQITNNQNLRQQLRDNQIQEINRIKSLKEIINQYTNVIKEKDKINLYLQLIEKNIIESKNINQKNHQFLINNQNLQYKLKQLFKYFYAYYQQNNRRIQACSSMVNFLIQATDSVFKTYQKMMEQSPQFLINFSIQSSIKQIIQVLEELNDQLRLQESQFDHIRASFEKHIQEKLERDSSKNNTLLGAVQRNSIQPSKQQFSNALNYLRNRLDPFNSTKTNNIDNINKQNKKIVEQLLLSIRFKKQFIRQQGKQNIENLIKQKQHNVKFLQSNLQKIQQILQTSNSQFVNLNNIQNVLHILANNFSSKQLTQLILNKQNQQIINQIHREFQFSLNEQNLQFRNVSEYILQLKNKYFQYPTPISEEITNYLIAILSSSTYYELLNNLDIFYSTVYKLQMDIEQNIKKKDQETLKYNNKMKQVFMRNYNAQQIQQKYTFNNSHLGQEGTQK